MRRRPTAEAIGTFGSAVRLLLGAIAAAGAAAVEAAFMTTRLLGLAAAIAERTLLAVLGTTLQTTFGALTGGHGPLLG